jgi:hypothetical protein
MGEIEIHTSLANENILLIQGTQLFQFAQSASNQIKPASYNYLSICIKYSQKTYSPKGGKTARMQRTLVY